MPIQFLTAAEAEAWCLSNGVQVVRGQPQPRGNKLAFAIPEDAGARTGLARVLFPKDETGEALIWTTEWSVWQSGEHMPLMRRLRQAMGEERALDVAPAQLVDWTSADDGKSLLIVNVLFLWDCWVISSGGEYIAHISHDEWGELYIADETQQAVLQEYLKKMDLLSDSST